MKEPKNIIPRIKYIKQLLKMPFHAFLRQDGLWVLWVENKKGEHLDWTSRTIAGTLEEALEYVRHELKMGALTDDIDEKKIITNEKNK